MYNAQSEKQDSYTTYQAKKEVQQFLVGENVERVASFGVNNGQTMNLIFNQHLNSIVQTVGQEGV